MAGKKLLLGHQLIVRRLFLLFNVFAICCPVNAQRPGESWQIRDQRDGMTGASTFFAFLGTKVESNDRTGKAEVTLRCNASELDFQIAYFSDSDRSLGLQRIQPGPMRVLGQVTIPQPRVSMRASIDGYLDRLEVPSPNTNAVNFEFTGGRGRFDLKRWAVDVVLQAKLIKFELPLANGDTPIVEIRPQDASFRRFADRCNAERSLVPHVPTYQREDKRFAGTADQFASEFPERLRQAATAAGLNAASFAKAAAIVVDTVKTCARITPAMGLSVAGKGPRGLDAGDQLEGGKYTHCFVGEGVRLLSTAGDVPPAAGERGLTLIISPPAGFPGGWVKGNSFGVDVFFPAANSANPYLLTAQDVETIVRARVDRAK
jgi:hypothetical protein